MILTFKQFYCDGHGQARHHNLLRKQPIVYDEEEVGDRGEQVLDCVLLDDLLIVIQ